MEPSIATDPAPDSTDESVEQPEASDEPEPPDPDVDEIELTEEDFGGEDLFADIEDSARTSTTSETVESPGAFEALGAGGSQLEVAINDGASRMAVIGLEERDELEAEFQEVFEAFRLGYFGSRFAEEYVLVDADEEIDPAWGLFGSALCCLAITLWMRPDGDEQLERLQAAVGNILGEVET